MGRILKFLLLLRSYGVTLKMVLNCGAHCARVILIILNTLFLCGGIAFLGIGIWLVVDNNALKVLRFAIGIVTTADLVWGAAVIVIVVSVVVILIAGFGFVGSVKTDACCLGFYSTTLMFLLVIQIVALILVGVFYVQINEKMATNLDMTLQTRYGKPEYEGTTKGWNILQTEIRCCGVQSSLDWSTSWWKQNLSQNTKNVPDQCCVLTNKNPSQPHPVDEVQCQKAAYNESYPNRSQYINAKGCEEKIKDWIKSYFTIIMSFVVALLAFQLVIILLACCLRSSSTKKVPYEEL